MKTPNFADASTKEIHQYALEASPEHITLITTNLSNNQLPILMEAFTSSQCQDWKERLSITILSLNDRSQLEVIGAALNAEQFTELIDHTLQIEEKHHWKLSPLLVGLPLRIFKHYLYHATDNELSILKQECVTEPIQHQLTLLGHEMENKISLLNTEIQNLINNIVTLNVENVSREDILEHIAQINLYGEVFDRLLNKTNKALSIAWNTNRTDLIETFNSVKIGSQRFSIYTIGKPRTKSEPPTGLYATLEEVLYDKDIEYHLKEDEPAIEALSHFSIWYLRDYWEVNLLPEITDEKKLDLDLRKHTEIERTQHREKLFSQVKQNLSKIGLTTFKDLKEAHVFSKKSLIEYIDKHKN